MSIHPVLRYTDAPAAIAFLTDTFGLVQGHTSTDDAGTVTHAELSWDDAVVMLGTRSDPPGMFDTGRAVLYLTTDDPDALHERVAAAGAEIVYGPCEQPYGFREFGAKDPEGNVWCFGAYRPTAQVSR
ncbi:VOC family protein [Pseudonocardia hispaniensis]|uniref:VOC family protein n=1 Tax=Pseudonocardia hispaniensis TaxID=904933 RepID=A0ABW1IZX2_9PSEU